MSELEYLQYVPSGPLPFVVGSAPVLLPMYFWHGTIFLLLSPTIVMFFSVALSP
jgi:hypothetical protein